MKIETNPIERKVINDAIWEINRKCPLTTIRLAFMGNYFFLYNTPESIQKLLGINSTLFDLHYMPFDFHITFLLLRNKLARPPIETPSPQESYYEDI